MSKRMEGYTPKACSRERWPEVDAQQLFALQRRAVGVRKYETLYRWRTLNPPPLQMGDKNLRE